ncbi:MAG: hypothetical protein JJE47_14610 [Acidimicrobiia bacterium]|nr:hypothetical protein [Acidimicrobiia bacterium]
MPPGERPNQWRLIAGFGLVGALALTLIVLTAQGGSPPSPLTASPPVTAATTSVTAPPTTAPVATSTTTEGQRSTEVEALLQTLWFGWFDAIYRKDPDALWPVVATTRFHDAGISAMDSMEFVVAPTETNVRVEGTKILLDRPDCLVVENFIDMTEFRGSVGAPTVSVLWPDSRYGFRFATGWKYANDLWLMDCDNLQREVTP